MVLDDLGNTGAGGSKTSSVTIPVIVRPTNHAPSLTLPTALSAAEDTLLSLAAVQVSDNDPGDTIAVDVTVSSGGLVQLSLLQLERYTELLRSHHQRRFTHHDATGESLYMFHLTLLTGLSLSFTL